MGGASLPRAAQHAGPAYAARALDARTSSTMDERMGQQQQAPSSGLLGITSLLSVAAVSIAAYVMGYRSRARALVDQPLLHVHTEGCRCCEHAGQPWAMATTTAEGEAPEKDLITQLCEASEDRNVLLLLLEKNWQLLVDSGVHTVRLQQLVAAGDPGAIRVLEGMNQVVGKLMEVAQARLGTLTQTTEINDLDRLLIKMAKQGEIDMAFLRVLDINIEDANSSGAEDRVTFFTHIRTRCIEEIEKLADPADGLISRSLRQTDTNIRMRILEDFLLPKTKVVLPSGQEMQLDKPSPPKVTIQQFADGLARIVERVQGMDVDGDLAMATIEDCRQLAKVARQVIITEYDEDKVRWFEKRLGEVFVQ